MQPCLSPVWDTAIAMIALADAQVPADHPSWAPAVEWLLAKEVRNPGDWCTRRPEWNQPAGTSSSETRFIRISTTARW